MTNSSGRTAFDFDNLYSGALRGWLAGLCGFALWILVTPTDPYGRVFSFVVFGAFHSLWYLGLVVIVGVPCFDVLRRLLPTGTPTQWGAWGAMAFMATAFALVFTLLDRKDVLDVVGSVVLPVIAGIAGGVTFYSARKAAGA